ncbi:MAG: hypothetical protein A2X23_04990 [Chloroflexi bacterium GWC2_73_18]|nr:MAG: hypothetical protein A2X23_04990 [Chloroflexi bacterium GWC2_73_18]
MMLRARPTVVPIALLAALAAAATLLLSTLPVLGHEGEEEPAIALEPASVTAGGSVLVAGTGLVPDTDRVLVLAGGNITVDFGTVRTDAEGMFRAELAIPAHLPGGLYEIRCIGDETLVAELKVMPAAMGGMPTPEPSPTSGAAPSPGPTPATGGAVPSAAPTPKPEATGPRPRSTTELGVLAGLALLLALAGAVLVVRAERLRGATAG